MPSDKSRNLLGIVKPDTFRREFWDRHGPNSAEEKTLGDIYRRLVSGEIRKRETLNWTEQKAYDVLLDLTMKADTKARLVSSDATIYNSRSQDGSGQWKTRWRINEKSLKGCDHAHESDAELWRGKPVRCEECVVENARCA